MIRSYLLDTNVVLQEPEAINHFKENIVIIPIGVIEELDRFKKENGELGKNSRDIARKLDVLRIKGDLRVGVELENGFGGIIKVVYDGNLDNYLKETNVDFHILHTAKTLNELNPDNQCIIVSRDVNVRIRANALGIMAEDYEASQITEEIDKGYSEVKCDVDRIERINNERKISINDCMDFFTIDPVSNHYLILKCDDEGLKKSQISNILAKVSPDRKFIEALEPLKGGLRLKPKNVEQTFVLDALMDERIKLVSIIGASGTGKSLLACAAGHYFLTKTDQYYKMLISRPMVSMGNKDTVGFLPGDLISKLDPWMQPIYDSFETLISSKKEIKDGREFVLQQKNIKIEVLAYIRGRSIHDQYFLIDEVQNTSALEIKTIITRAGEGTKVVLTGDIDQIDNPYLDKYSNGLTIATKSFIGSELAAHIVMTKGVRSRLSEEASHRL